MLIIKFTIISELPARVDELLRAEVNSARAQARVERCRSDEVCRADVYTCHHSASLRRQTASATPITNHERQKTHTYIRAQERER